MIKVSENEIEIANIPNTKHLLGLINESKRSQTTKLLYILFFPGLAIRRKRKEWRDYGIV